MKHTGKNIFGQKKDLILYHKNGEIAYWFFHLKGITTETFYNKKGLSVKYSDSNQYWYEQKFDKKGNRIFYQNSAGLILNKKYATI